MYDTCPLIIIKYLLLQWHTAIDVDCPQMRRCIEIAQICVNRDPHNRPTTDEIIHNLKEIETLYHANQTSKPKINEPRDDPRSSLHQVCSCKPNTQSVSLLKYTWKSSLYLSMLFRNRMHNTINLSSSELLVTNGCDFVENKKIEFIVVGLRTLVAGIQKIPYFCILDL